MKKQAIKLTELLFLGFTSSDNEPLENGDYYYTVKYRKNDSEICFTYECNNKNKITNCFVDFNCEILKGKPLTKIDVELLIEIM